MNHLIFKKIEEFEEKGYTVMILAENKKAIGIIGVADAIKEDSAKALKELNTLGFRTIMLTGDNETTARAISRQAGISEIIANVLPEEKEPGLPSLYKIQTFLPYLKKKQLVIPLGDSLA